jgi:hypothetical protein
MLIGEVEHAVDVEAHPLLLVGAGEGLERPHDAADLLGPLTPLAGELLDLPHPVGGQRPGERAHLLDDEVEVGGEVGERVVDLVRDPGGERAHGGHAVVEEKLRLGLLALGDVEGGGEVAHDLAPLVAQSHRAAMDPDDAPVGHAVAVLHRELTALPLAEEPLRGDPLPVVGVQHEVPRLADDLGGGVAGELAPALVDEGAGSGEVGLEDAHGHLPGERPDAAVALAARALGPALRGHVHHLPDDLPRHPVLVGHHRRVDHRLQHLAALADEALGELVAVDLPAQQPPTCSAMSAARSSGWLTSLKDIERISSTEYPSSSLRLRFTCSQRPSALVSAIPMGAWSNARRKRSSAARSSSPGLSMSSITLQPLACATISGIPPRGRS